MKLLVVEDDPTTSDYIVNGLREEGHVVDHLVDGRDALTQAMAGGYEVMVVDRMLLGLDGLSLVKALRAAKVTTPAIFLTAIGGVEDRIEGLQAGGDDYLVKPFAFGELSARIQALARRPQAAVDETALKAGDLVMDLIRRRVTRAGINIDLLPREFALLEHLMRRKGRVQIRKLLELNNFPDRPCDEANEIVAHLLQAVEIRIARLEALKQELARMIGYCSGGRTADCRVLQVLKDHSECLTDHEAVGSGPVD